MSDNTNTVEADKIPFSEEDKSRLIVDFLRLIKQDPKANETLKVILFGSERSFRVNSLLESAKSHRKMGVYYQRVYAEQIKKHVDDMIDKRQANYDSIEPKMFFLARHNYKYTIDTLYARLEQSIRYLVDHFPDINQKYIRWRQSVAICRVLKAGVPAGVAIRWHDEMAKEEGELIADPIDNLRDTNTWKPVLYNWLEIPYSAELTKEERKLDLTNIVLSPEEVAEVKSQIADLEQIEGNVTYNRILLVKVASKGQT